MSDEARKMNIRAKSASIDVDDLIAQAGGVTTGVDKSESRPPAPSSGPSPAPSADSPAPSPAPSSHETERPAPPRRKPAGGSPAVAEAPWAAADPRIRKTVLLYLAEREKMMLDFIRDRTSVPSQRFLARVLLPAIEAEAQRLLEDDAKNQ